MSAESLMTTPLPRVPRPLIKPPHLPGPCTLSSFSHHPIPTTEILAIYQALFKTGINILSNLTSKQSIMWSPERLGPAAVLQSMADALPIHQRGDTTSDMSATIDCIALLVHACMVNLNFTFIGFHLNQDISASNRDLRSHHRS